MRQCGLCSVALTIPQEISKWRTSRRRKNEAHTMANEDIFCGVRQVVMTTTSLVIRDLRASILSKIHIFGSCSSSSMTNMHVVDPTGEAIQLDGSWTSCSSGGSSDALQKACSQGTCSSCTPTSSCSSQLDTLCSSVKQQNDVCTDCICTRWSTFSSAGCDNAVSSSPSPFSISHPMPPSPSTFTGRSLRQVCVCGR